MEENNSLVIFTRASQMLAEADTIQKTKELKDLALTAADWARRKGMGKEAIHHATSYALEAERKMGEMLKQTERAKGTRLGGNVVLPPDETPTLSDLGLTKRESAEAQMLAGLSRDIFDEIKEGEKTIKQVRREIRQEEIRSGLPDPIFSNNWYVEIGDINNYETEKKFDFIITDPPYPRKYLPLYEVLARRALEWLNPNGLLVAMCGQSYLPEIYNLLSEHLNYYWTACYLTPGQPTPLRTRQVNTTWKPILIFSKTSGYSGKIFGDVFKSDGSDKDHHEWGQSVSGMTSLVTQICLPGQSIFDPFCGAGTTGIAALKHGCFFHGIDIEKENVHLSKQRLTGVENDSK